MSDKSILDDVLQEVIMQVFLKINTLKNNKVFGCWIYRVTVNVCMKYGRTLTKINTKMMKYFYSCKGRKCRIYSGDNHSSVGKESNVL